jgi:hypothetical protein
MKLMKASKLNMVRIISFGIIFIMILSFPVGNNHKEKIDSNEIKTEIKTTTYSNSDITTLWVRKNGTDPYPFNFYDGANVSPSYGMNYFGTNVIQVTWDYNFTEISNLALFPIEADIYIQTQYDALSYTAIADFALADYTANGRQRIRGAFIDDFQVGLQSPSNMTNYSTALRHENANLSYNLTLGLIVYNRNYMNQNGYVPNIPYSWYEISAYFEIIHFWFYPFSYQLLYPNFCGYESDFLWLHNLMPTKEYWLGIYLHYYNIGSYDLAFTEEQMSIAGKLIKQGYATRYSLLENFWIQHNTPTALLIKNFINNQFQMNYSTIWYYGSQTTLRYSKGVPIIAPTLQSIHIHKDTRVYPTYIQESWIFTSLYLQNLTIRNNVTEHFILYNMRNGNWQYPYYDIVNQTASYILEPYQTYRIMNRPLTPLTYASNTTITSNTTWENKLVTIYGMITFNDTILQIDNSIVRIGNPNINNSMYYHTNPWYGIKIGTNNMRVYIFDSIIEPILRAYPYYFNRPYQATSYDDVFVMTDSVLVGYSYQFRPAGHIVIENSTLANVQPLLGNNPTGLWAECPSYVILLYFNDNIVFNYPISGIVGVFLMPWVLPDILHDNEAEPNWRIPTIIGGPHILSFKFNRNIIIGGNYGLWIDLSYSVYTSKALTINDLTSYPFFWGDTLFTTFRVDGTTDKSITINTYNIFIWSVKGSIPGPALIINYLIIDIGIYILTINGVSSNVAVTTNTYYILYNGLWLAYRDNFSFLPFSTFLNPENTMENLIWLLFVFIIPISMAQVVPKIGFIFGMILSLILWTINDASLLPYMFIGMLAIGIMVYKGR